MSSLFVLASIFFLSPDIIRSIKSCLIYRITLYIVSSERVNVKSFLSSGRFFQDHECDVLMSCEEWQTEFSDCSICFLFSSFDIWYGQPGVGSPSSGGIWELGLFCWIFRGARGRSTYFCGLLSDTE